MKVTYIVVPVSLAHPVWWYLIAPMPSKCNVLHEYGHISRNFD